MFWVRLRCCEAQQVRQVRACCLLLQGMSEDALARAQGRLQAGAQRSQTVRDRGPEGALVHTLQLHVVHPLRIVEFMFTVR